jgi:hypothetical protein
MKRKAALASAIFGMVVLASCGGGGSGESSSSNSSPSTQQPPSASQPPSTPSGPVVTDAKVLALTLSGPSSKTIQVNICDLKSDGTISCGDNISPRVVDYVYEFSNGNVILIGSDNKAYYFDPTTGTVNKLIGGKDLEGNTVSDLDFTTYNNMVKIDINPNFIIFSSSNKGYAVVAKTGKYVVSTSSGGGFYIGDNFIVVTDDVNNRTYRIDINGNVSEIKDGGASIKFKRILTRVGDNILVEAFNPDYAIYLLKDDGTLMRISSTESLYTPYVVAQMIKVGNDFYIAISDSYRLYYYKNNVNLLNNPVKGNIGMTDYAFDGSGNLYYSYYSNGFCYVKAIKTDSTSSSNSISISIPASSAAICGGLIGIPTGVIAVDVANKKLLFLSISGNNNIISQNSTDSDLFDAVRTCIGAKYQDNGRKFQFIGENTNQIMCTDTRTADFSWITYDGSTYKGKQLAPIPSVVGIISYPGGTDPTKPTHFTQHKVDYFGDKAVIYNLDSLQTEVCSVGSDACILGLNLQGYTVLKQYNSTLAVGTPSSGGGYTLSIADLLTATSKPIFTNLSDFGGGNISADISMAAGVSNSNGSSCPDGFGNVIQLYTNGTTKTYKSDKLCIYENLLKLYKQ